MRRNENLCQCQCRICWGWWWWWRKNRKKENNFGNAYRGRKEGLAMEGKRSTRTFRFCFMKFRWNFHVLIFMKFRPVIYPLDPFLQPGDIRTSLVVYFRFIESFCRLLRINLTISTESRSVFFSNTKIHWGTRDDGSDDDNSDDYDCDLITHMTTRQNLSRTWTNWKILSSEKEKCAVRKMESLFRYFTYKFSIFVSAKCKVATWSIILIFLKWEPDFC